ncbi:HAMP domain-containing histidine kinase [Akkermansiaceae bacterium]|nr:HAMP domain-containing histidine kinase [Akkermansiaceae bacterium]
MPLLSHSAPHQGMVRNKPTSMMGKIPRLLTLLSVPGANPTLKRVLALLILAILLSLAGGTYFATRTLGEIDEVQHASHTLDQGTLGFSPKFRASVYQIQALALRSQISGDSTYTERFDLLESDLLSYVDSQAGIFDLPEEQTLFATLTSKLSLFLQQLKVTLPDGNAPGRSGSLSAILEDFEKIQILRDDIIELANQLANLRRASFQSSLTEYQSQVNGLRYFIFIALGVLVTALFVIGWLARTTFLKPMEAHLAQAEKTSVARENLATIGTVASGVAHEIRNPITTIKARLFALTELTRGEESQARQVEAIQSETNRMERIVQDLLTFARPADPDLEKTALDEFLDQIHESLAPEILARGISFVIGRNDEAYALIDADQLKQVMHNLIRNASEACPGTLGEISLSSERQGEQILLSVSDNGSGIPKEHQARIFEPFFSKKKGGTGLGLSICRNIIEAHQGTLTFTTNSQSGTTFTITLDTL